MTSILLVARRSEYADELNKKYRVTEVPSGKEAAEVLKVSRFDLVVLDSISLRTPGERIARALKQTIGEIPLIHLHPGTKSASEGLADIVLEKPFSMRRINNAIARLLTAPQKKAAVLHCGPFTVDVDRRLLTVKGQERSLTPKTLQLVEIFFSHPGETLDRRILMEKVWQTDYVGDTRTLDVHVRWIRRAIEEDPGNPRYLVTVRGTGYRLDVPVMNGHLIAQTLQAL